MFPCVGGKDLYRLVDCGATCHEQAQCQWVEAVDVVEVDQLELFAAEGTHQPYGHEDGKNHNEIRGMRVAEHVDGLRNTVGRYKIAFQVGLAQPALHFLRV